MQDVGKPKAEVAAQRVMQRVKGVTVVPHFCRIEEKDITFYQDFQIIVLGLDSLEARSYINSVVCGFLGLILQPLACISKFRCCKFNLNLLRLCHPFHLSQLKLLEISACSSGLFQVGDTKYAFYLNCCGIMSTIWCFWWFYWKFSLYLLIERLFFLFLSVVEKNTRRMVHRMFLRSSRSWMVAQKDSKAMPELYFLDWLLVFIVPSGYFHLRSHSHYVL